MLLILPRRLIWAPVAGRPEAASCLARNAGRTVEGLPRMSAPNQQRAAQQVLVAGEEDPLDAATGFLQPSGRVRAGHDDNITGGYTNDELAGNRSLKTLPDIVGEQEARFETLEGEHQRGRLAVELGPAGEHLEMFEGRAAQRLRGHRELVQVGVGDDTPAKLRAERVDNVKIPEAVFPNGAWIYPVTVGWGQEGNERGTGHLHRRNLAAGPRI
jgi:hypothetical protein